jgi:hypothetical protein
MSFTDNTLFWINLYGVLQAFYVERVEIIVILVFLA